MTTVLQYCSGFQAGLGLRSIYSFDLMMIKRDMTPCMTKKIRGLGYKRNSHLGQAKFKDNFKCVALHDLYCEYLVNFKTAFFTCIHSYLHQRFDI